MFKVLIIDDEYSNRLLLEEILEDYDKPLEIITAEFGDQGLDMIKREKPEVVFLDIMLPIVSGTEICRIVKNELKMKDVKIILITAMGNFESDNIISSELADGYLRKPFNSKQVISELNKTINRK